MKGHGCLNVLVPCLGSNFLLKSRKSLVCLLVIQVWLWVRCVDESKFLKLSPDKVIASLFLSHPYEGFPMVLFDRVCKLLGRQRSISAVVDYLACGGQNLGSHDRTNLNGRSKILPEY